MLERNLGRAQAVLHGFLEFLLRHSKELLSGGDTNRHRIRKLAKFLNMRGGVCILDCLSKAEIMDLLEAEYSLIQDLETTEPAAETVPT